MSQDFKRRKLLINPSFQIRFMGYIGLALLIGFTVLYVSNFLYYDLLIDEGNDLGLDSDHPYFGFIEDQRALLTKVYLSLSAVVFVLLMVFGLFLSHRIAGPLHHMQRVMRLVQRSEGDGARVHLRDGDFFTEIEEVINETIAHYEALLEKNLAESDLVKDLAGAKLLVVEDNPINQELVLEILTSNGLLAECADNGQIAVEMLKTDSAFDGVLMDGQMPEMDGYEATRVIRSELGMTQLPIIAMTANISGRDKQKALDAGMNKAISKPIVVSELFTTLGDLVTPSNPIFGRAYDESEASEVVIPDIDGVDTKAGLVRTQNNPLLYLRLLRRFVDTNKDFGQRLQQSAEDKNIEILAHTLKGVAGNIGADAVQALSHLLEGGFKAGASAVEKERMSVELCQELDKIVNNIEVALKSVEEGTATREMTDEDIAKLIIEMRRLIQASDTRVTELIHQLVSVNAGDQKRDIDALFKAVSHYDFDQAEAVLNRLALNYSDQSKQEDS